MEAEIKIIYGPPGTGKTTKLLSIMETELGRGVEPEEIAFVSFTKKAAKEAMDRVRDQFRLTAENFPYIRTLHSLAYQVLGVKRNEVLQPQNYKELGEYLGLDFSSSNVLEDGVPAMKYLGDRYTFMDGYARARKISTDQVWRKFGDYDLNIWEFERFRNALREYKMDRNLIDFSDMLEQPFNPLPVKVAIIDEAQDLSTLQWSFVSQIFGQVERMYIAGDDDQAIYQWSGADVNTFLNIPGERQVLHQSWRIPKAIHEFATDITSRIDNRANKEYIPAPHEGYVDFHRYMDTVDISSGTWLLLARNGYMLHKLAKMAKDQGVYFGYKGGRSVNQEHLKAITYWEAFRKGNYLSIEERLFLDEYLPVELQNSTHLPDRIWHEVLTKIPLEDREYYISLLRRGEKITKNPRVNISTIHGVKGGEADNVLLLTDITWKTHESTRLNPDSEHRVWYVGATRARNNLHVVSPQTKLFYQV